MLAHILELSADASRGIHSYCYSYAIAENYGSVTTSSKSAVTMSSMST